MLGNIRDSLPVILVPSAWLLAYATLSNSVESNPMMVAHFVMMLFISVFLITGYDKMRNGALRAWLGVLSIGLIITVIGFFGFYNPDYSATLHKISLFGWMIIPSVGLIYTGYETEKPIYYVSSIIAFFGIISAYIIPVSLSVLIVAVGQTIGIGKAVWDS